MTRCELIVDGIKFHVIYDNTDCLSLELKLHEYLSKKNLSNIHSFVNKNKSQILELLKFYDIDRESIKKHGSFEQAKLIYEKIKDNIFFDDYVNDLLQIKIKAAFEYYNKLLNPEIKEIQKHVSNIYLMKNLRNGYTKIGYSDNPKKRERTLQSEEPEIELIFKIKTYSSYEEFLHEHFKEKRIRGEWFNLDSDDIEKITNFLKREEIK